MTKKPYIGAVLQYVLDEENADHINRRRTTGADIAQRQNWPQGAQAHIGRFAEAGQVCALIVTETHDDGAFVNGQVLLDGNDTLWVTTVEELDENRGVREGGWRWPE